MREWLDNSKGLGQIVTGMARQDYDVQLTRYDGRGWRATFFGAGMVHSLTSMTGTASEATPWRAVQVAAWNALGKVPRGAARAASRRRHSPVMGDRPYAVAVGAGRGVGCD